MAEQVDIIDGGDLGGTMRLGLYPAELAEGSLAAELYGSTARRERHRHRYEVNNRYRDQHRRGRPGVLGPLARPQPRRVRRAAARRAPVLHRDAGAPRAALAADRPAPAVPRPRRRRARAPQRERAVRRRAMAESRSRRRRALRDEPVDARGRSRATLRLRGTRVGRPQRHRSRYGDGEIVRAVRRPPRCRRRSSRSTTTTACC